MTRQIIPSASGQRSAVFVSAVVVGFIYKKYVSLFVCHPNIFDDKFSATDGYDDNDNHNLGGCWGSGQAGLQTHTRGGLQAHTQGVSRPTPGGGCPGPHLGDVSQHALRQTLPPPPSRRPLLRG